MKVLLTSNASYDPPKGGSTRANLAWLKHLAAAGHAVSVVSAADSDALSSLDGISIRGLRNLSFRAAELASAISAFSPDHVLVSSEDLSHVLLRKAAAVAMDRLVYLAHTPQWFPFGPESWNPDPAAARIVANARAVVVIGPHMADYVQTHLGRAASVIHPPIYGSPPYRRLGRFGSGCVLLVNPCAAKGISIFLALADRFPQIQFAGLAGWGTTAADRAAMSARPNVKILETVPSIEDALCQATVLLMPSLWYEGFGLIAMEAMLRGLPVLASTSGGLVDAKRGAGYVVEANPIRQWLPEFDDTHMPVAVVPPQDIGPWARALKSLLEDETEYWRESESSRQVALDFVSRLDAAEFEALLLSLGDLPKPPRTAAVSRLTPQEIELLRGKLKQRRGGV
jgi:glycosyltransferase involved in cell wall biosynthesis